MAEAELDGGKETGDEEGLLYKSANGGSLGGWKEDEVVYRAEIKAQGHKRADAGKPLQQMRSKEDGTLWTKPSQDRGRLKKEGLPTMEACPKANVVPRMEDTSPPEAYGMMEEI